MIQKEKEVRELAGILKTVDSCDTCRLGLVDGNRAYIVPLCFGYTFLNGKFTFYFQSRLDEKKTARIKAAEEAAEEITFQMDANHCMLPVGGSEYTMLYSSAFGCGRPVFLNGEEEKRTALKHILAHYIPGKFAEDQNSLPENACIFKLEVTELTCRENR